MLLRKFYQGHSFTRAHECSPNPSTLPHLTKERGQQSYPRRTFDPLSTNLSTQCLWVTTANFRFCSTCRSHSQASLYCCALQLISDQLELTFARSRYSLGNVVNLIFLTRKTALRAHQEPQALLEHALRHAHPARACFAPRAAAFRLRSKSFQVHRTQGPLMDLRKSTSV